MEQAAVLTIVRNEHTYTFRLDLPDGSQPAGPEQSRELSAEIVERLRRLLQQAAQSMAAAALAEARRQTVKLSNVNDALVSLGRFLFETLLPESFQEALRHLEVPLIFSTNTPEIPWELLIDVNARTNRYLS